MKSVLGRGLGELLSEVEIAYENENDTTSIKVIDIDINLIVPNPDQPRKVFKDEKIEELSDSILKHGLLQPINVTRDGSQYILISGERRLRASKLANLPTIKASILNVDDKDLRELALIENIQRDDLNVVELAYSYAKLISEHNLTHDELAQKVCKSRTTVTNTLRLLNLSIYVQQKLSSEDITLGHAKVMIGLDDNQQKRITDSIIGQKLSVRETERIVSDLKNNPKIEEKKKNKKQKLNFEVLNDTIETLKSNNLKTTVANNFIKIYINSQEDIETLSSYFSK